MARRKSHRDLVAAIRDRIEITTPTAPARSAIEDGGAEVAEARARASIELGRPLRPSEARQVRAQVRKAHAAGPEAAQPGRPTVDEWLERLSPGERATIEQSERFAQLSETAQNYVLRRREALEDVDEQAEWLAAQQLEDERLAELGDDEEFDWENAEAEDSPYEAALAAQLQADSDAARATWSPQTMTAEEALGFYDEDEEVA
jgi:hypothetical protein